MTTDEERLEWCVRTKLVPVRVGAGWVVPGSPRDFEHSVPAFDSAREAIDESMREEIFAILRKTK